MPSDHDLLADRLHAQLRAEASDSIYELWLEPLRVEAVEGTRLLVGAPDTIRAWVSDRFAALIETCACAVLGASAQVAIVPLGGDPAAAPAADHDGAEPGLERRGVAALAETFNPKYSFEQFVIGDANRLAHAAALAVAELPSHAYNPLFITGPPGLGKTHLLHAIANFLALNEPGAVVRYTTTEAFTNHFIHALNSGAMEHFKSLYRATDVLLVDDVQFLESKARTEEEFFHTFNALYETGAQLVLTSDRVPADLLELEDRLRARFEAGLVCDVHPPDAQTRLTILRKRVHHDRVGGFPDSALARIAERITANIRALEGALIRVVAFHSLTRRAIDPALVDEVLDGLYPGTKPPRRTVEDIQQATCQAFSLTVDELRSPSRVARIAWPRQVAMYLARELTEESLPAIGRRFGGRNHATVLHACRRTAERISSDPAAFTTVHRLSQRLTGPGDIRPA